MSNNRNKQNSKFLSEMQKGGGKGEKWFEVVLLLEVHSSR